MRYASYSNEGDEHRQFESPVDVAVGEPVELSLDYWGVSPLGVRAGSLGDFRVSGRFRCLKAIASDSFAFGDLLEFTSGVGFSAGGTSWRCVEDSPSGQSYVMLEINAGSSVAGGGPVPVEVVRQDGSLSGSAPIDSKIGVDHSTGNLFFRNTASEWQPVSVAASNEDFDFSQLAPLQTWVIDHNRNRQPDDVTIFNLAGAEVYSTVTNPTLNRTVISFSIPQAGRANLEFQT